VTKHEARRLKIQQTFFPKSSPTGVSVTSDASTKMGMGAPINIRKDCNKLCFTGVRFYVGAKKGTYIKSTLMPCPRFWTIQIVFEGTNYFGQV
jgi:hypothetical protein